MSATIDERVVEMRFDNKQFEAGAKESLNTIDKLKQALNFTESTKAFDTLQKTANGVTMEALGKAVDSVKVKFSALEVAAITALTNIVNRAVDAGVRLVKSLSLDQVTAGFSEYELKMGSIQTIMASTGESLSTVNGYLEELNRYADRTIYSFSDMTNNIGKFTNAGVKLEDAVKAIQGISNEAAVSGANANEASRAMYNFAQALSAGYVKLIDWKSIENANMATVEFKQALLDTAVAMGTVVKEGDKYRSTTTDLNGKVSELFDATSMFNDSLSSQWLSTDVLVQTLNNYSTDVRDMTDAEREAYEQKLRSVGYTDEQIKSIEELGKKAFDSAQDVKTFTQLMDTLKESVGSGWAQTFELIFGDFEEAKKLWTNINNVIGGILQQQSDARNDLLKGWKEAGGRDALIEGLANAWNALAAAIKPVKDAFRDIFPPLSVEQLVKATKSFADLTSKLRISDETSEKLRKTFSGLFAIVDIGKSIAELFFHTILGGIPIIGDVGGGILDITAAIGDWLTRIDNAIKKNKVFVVATKAISAALDSIHKAFKSFADSIKVDTGPIQKFFDFLAGGFEKVTTGLSKSAPTIEQVAETIGGAFSSLGRHLVNAFTGANLEGFVNFLSSGIFLSIGKNIQKFIKSLTSVTDGASGFISGLKKVNDTVIGTLGSLQDSLNATTLTKIAAAVGVLALSLIALATIDSKKLNKSLGAIAILFGELFIALGLFEKYMAGGKLKSVSRLGTTLIGMSTSLLILAGAMKMIASVDADRLTDTLKAITVLLTEMTAVALVLSNYGGKVKTGALAMIGFGAAILILAQAVKQLSDMDIDKLTNGLVAVDTLMAEMALVTTAMGNAKHVLSSGAAMVLMATSLNMLVGPITTLGNMPLESLAKSLVAIGVALGEMVIAMRSLPKNMLANSVGMIAVSAALMALTGVIKILAGIPLEGIVKSLYTIGVALGELSLGLDSMKGSLKGSAALLVASVAILALTPALKALGNLGLGKIVTGLIALAGAFTVMGIAAAVLQPLAPTILALSAAMTLLGVAVLAAGVGLTAFAAGVASLASSGLVAVTSIVASLDVLFSGIFNAIRDSAKSFAGAVKAVVLELCDVIVECVPSIVKVIMEIVKDILEALEKNAPEIVDSLLKFIIGVIDALEANLPTLIQSVVNLFMTFFAGIVDALREVDTDILVKAIAGVGLIAALMLALAGMSALAPAALSGVLSTGLVIAELSAVLAAFGALSQIPGLQWLISEGGDFLQTVGTAIGQFIGGIVGGFASGVSEQLPKIASDLSDFMSNIEPFFDGVKKIDQSASNGVKALAQTILILTAANILDGLASWLTGGSSLADFGDELARFGPKFAAYYNSVKGIDGSVVEASANAATTLAEMANKLPNQGGVISWFVGDNTLSVFAKELERFGPSFKRYGDSIRGIDADAVNSSALAASALSEMASSLPNQGGLISWFVGDNTLSTFGRELAKFGPYMAQYSKSVSGMDTNVVTSSVNAAKALAELSNNLPNQGGIVSWFKGDNDFGSFGKGLAQFGNAMRTYYQSVAGIDTSVLSSVIIEVRKLVDLASGVASIDTSGLGQFATNLQTMGNNGITAFITAFEGSYDRVVAAVNTMIGYVTSSIGQGNAKISKSAESVGVAMATGIRNGVSSKQKEITKTATTIASSVLTALNKGLAANQLKSFGATAIQALANGIKSKASAVNNEAKSIATNVINSLRNGLPATTFTSIGSTAIQNLINGMSSKKSSVSSTATSIGKSVVSAIKSGMPSKSFKSVGQSAMTSLADGLSSKKSSVTKAAKSAASGAASAAKKEMSYNTFYNIGANAGSGLAAGLKNQGGSIGAAARGVAYAAINSAKKALGIHSPSRVFREFGENLPKAMSLGINDNLEQVANAGKGLAEEAVDPVRLAMERIASVMEGEDSDFRPTITPVLDLTNVENGAGQISGMFQGVQLSAANNMAQAAYFGFDRNAAFGVPVDDSAERRLEERLDRLIAATEDSKTENINTFYVTSTDPKEAADEIGYLLDRKVERGKAIWAK